MYKYMNDHQDHRPRLLSLRPFGRPRERGRVVLRADRSSPHGGLGRSHRQRSDILRGLATLAPLSRKESQVFLQVVAENRASERCD